MTTNKFVLVERKGAITHLTLNRHEKRNALNEALMEQLYAAIIEAEQMPLQRSLIISGMGSAFCAGLDLKEAALPEKIESLAILISKILMALYQSRLATIAAVNGAAMAGGAGIMSACDFVICAPEAVIGYPEVHKGLVAAQVMTLLTRQVNWRTAKELLLLGQPISAQRAKQIGLVNSVVNAEDLLKEAYNIAGQIEKISKEPFYETKHLLRQLEVHPFEEDMKKALIIHLKTRKSYANKQ